MISPHFIKSIVKIESQISQGSGFFISNNLILTARHVISSEEVISSSTEYTIETSNKIVIATKCIADDSGLDIAVLEIVDPSNKIDIHPMELFAKEIQIGELWSTFGYPKAKADAGAHIDGSVSLNNIDLENNHYEVDLQYNQIQSLDGFSGSPLIINDRVVGIVVEALDSARSIGANSIKSLATFFQKNKIDINNNEETRAEEQREIVNQATLLNFKNTVDRLTSGYVFLGGKPGSGKTTFVDSLTENILSDNKLLKYIIRKNGAENKTTINKTPENIANWLLDNLYIFIHETLPNKQKYTNIEAITKINDLLKEASMKVISENKKLTICIDGIDEIGDLSFYDFFPENLPDNIVIAFSGQTNNSLSNMLQMKVSNNQITLTSLSKSECKMWIQDELPKLTYSLQDEIIAHSDCYPLYLHYLISYIKNNFKVETYYQINTWLASMPKIDGKIEEYYEYLWKTIEDQEDHLYFMSLISRLREGINSNTLVLLLPEQYKHKVNSLIQELVHVLVSPDCIYPYHISIKHFIDKKTELSSIVFHETISSFCKANLENIYSRRNILWHLLLASDIYREEALHFCNQSWADRCAIEFLEPDLILNDLELVLIYALDKGDIYHSLRLLLLKQRISFRYNDVFALSTSEIVDFLISQNQKEKIISYLIRYNKPLISDDHILYYQSYFYQNGDIQNAEILKELICSSFIKEIEANNGVAINALVNYFKARTIEFSFSEAPFRYSAELIEKTINFLQKTNINQQNKMQLFSYLAGYNKGAILFLKADYISSKEVINECLSNSAPIDIAVLSLAQTFNTCKLNERIEAKFVDKTLLFDDLNFVLSHYLLQPIDSESALILFDLLTGANIKTEYLEKIIGYMPTIDIPPLRQANGVDVNINWVKTNFQKGCIEGFKDTKRDISELELSIHFHHSSEISSDEWEGYFAQILHYIGKLMGKAWRLKTMSDVSELITDDVLNSLFESLKFTLKQRAHFDRGYHIPEFILPKIYSKITEILIDYEPNKIPLLLKFLHSYGTIEQLGVYTEGFRTTIRSILDILPKDNQNRKEIFQILKMLEEHILLGVQNRWERTPELFYLATQYNKLGNLDRASGVFQEVLNTSMGPTWYKEAQLELIDASLKIIESETIDWDITKIAGILDFASGEMTFQRYIRTEKENLIENLCQKNKLAIAIAYFKNQTIPDDLSLIFERINKKQIDVLEEGRGYDRGYNYIDTQRAILNILKNTNNIEYSTKWILLELYLVGDPRYLDDFAELFVQILNDLNKEEVPYLEFYQKRLEVITQEILPTDQRSEFDRHIKEKLNSRSYELIQPDTNLSEPSKLASGNDLEGDHDEDMLYLPGTFGKKSGIKDFELLVKEAQEESEIENFSKAKTLYLQSLQQKQTAGWGIWHQNHDPDSHNIFKEIIKLSNSSSEFIKSVSSLILNEKHESYWGMVHSLIMNCANQTSFLSQELKEDLHQLLIEHIEIIVNPDKDIYKSYGFLNKINLDQTENSQFIKDLIIPLAESPDPLIRIRAHETLTAFAQHHPEIYLPLMFQYSIEKSNKYSAEMCSSIIVKIARENLILVEKTISLDMLNALFNIKQLTIVTNYLQILAYLQTKNENYKTILTRLCVQLFKMDISSSDLEQIIARLVSLPSTDITSYLTISFERLRQLQLLDQNVQALIETKVKESYGITTKQLNQFESLMPQDSRVYAMLRTPALNEVLYSKINQTNFFPIIYALKGIKNDGIESTP